MRIKENTTNLLILVVICIASIISPAIAFPRQKKLRAGHLSKLRNVYMDYSRSSTNQPVSNEVQLESLPNSMDGVKQPTQPLDQTREIASFGKKVKASDTQKTSKRGKTVSGYSKTHRSLHAKASNDGHAASDEAEEALETPDLEKTMVEKGMDILGKLSDESQGEEEGEEKEEKAPDSGSNKEVRLDITPDKGWKTEDMFLPSGYHIDAAVSEGEKSPSQEAPVPFTYPAGIGGVLMNGCWGTDYKENDPCYNSKTTEDNCDNMMEGAGFLGVGFDGRGKYSPDSRKMSIIQRLCANEATYAGEDVPDTMNVHGIYDTTASLITFESRTEYSKFLQQEAGISGSYFGFSAGVSEAWGESSQSSSQKFLAVMDVDVSSYVQGLISDGEFIVLLEENKARNPERNYASYDRFELDYMDNRQCKGIFRYEIFMDEVKPKDLSLSFLREFMNLPLSYFSTGAPLLYQNFIQRWGTHYIKSAKFGGQLEIRKTMDAKDAKSKKEFEVEMEVEYKNLFSSVGAKASAKKGESSRKQSKTTSTSIVAQGGSQEIASILSDVYSPTFKTEFKHWLQTIPSYPKAFKFHMGSISDLLNFRANDLFPDEKVKWGCEGNALNLKTETKDGETVKYYEVVGKDGKKTRHYCEFDSRQALENAIRRRRTSLLRAMEIYMEEGAISISDTELGACKRKQGDDEEEDDYLDMPPGHPSWKQIVTDGLQFKISFDMLDDLSSTLLSVLDIGRNTSRLVRYQDNRWQTSDRDGNFHLYGEFDNGDSKDISRHKISILGLVLTFNEAQGTLSLSPEDYSESKTFFQNLGENMLGIPLARLEMLDEKAVKRGVIPAGGPISPCKVYWSNALRLDPTDSQGKCLHFTASTEGTIFVVFAALPKVNTTWYTIEISRKRVAIYKGTQIKTQTTNVNARGLGDYSLHQSYFICITETEISTVIEYGKSIGTSDSGDVYLNFIDSTNHLNVRFYAFGNDEKPAKVMDAHIVSRSLTQVDCKGDTTRDRELDMCVQKCHPYCDPLAGCKKPNDPRVPQGCYTCRVGLDPETNECIAKCPRTKTLTRDKRCIPSSDVSLRPSADYGPVEIGDVPTMRELTLCLWLKIEGTWLKQGAKGIYLVRYELDSVGNFFEFYLDEASLYSSTPERIALRFAIGGSSKNGKILDGLDNGKWQQLCVTWNGFTAAVAYYRNGSRLHSSEYRVGEIKGGGTLKLGGLLNTGTGKREVTIVVTGLNLWDKVLSDQEITNNAKKCDAGEGNAKEWHKWYDAAYKTFGYKTSPSHCRPLRRF